MVAQPPSPPDSGSPFFEIRQTPAAGRGLFASQALSPGTTLLTSSRPSAHVIFRQYRKEVCAWCFAYDRGRPWRVRDPDTGFSFCAEGCRVEWMGDAGEVGRAGWVAVEGLVRASLKRGRERERSEEDARARLPVGIPESADIWEAWSAAEDDARALVQTRLSSAPTKAHTKLVRAAQDPSAPSNAKRIVDADTLAFLFSGLHTSVANPPLHAVTLTLAPHSAPYDHHVDLLGHTSAYALLAAVLPVSYLPHLTPERLYEIASRDSRNSFGIRSTDGGGDDGAEFLGYGTWGGSPALFNHSCNPSIGKRRDGALWQFESRKAVEEGEELYISYLGEGTAKMTLQQRRKTLIHGWGFTCMCARCTREDGSAGGLGFT